MGVAWETLTWFADNFRPEPIAVPVLEAVRLSGISRSELYRRLAAGDIRAVKSGVSHADRDGHSSWTYRETARRDLPRTVDRCLNRKPTMHCTEGGSKFL